MVRITIRYGPSRKAECAVTDALFMKIMNALSHIVDLPPSAEATLAEVHRWHIGRVCRRSKTLTRAASTLGTTRQSLRRWQRGETKPKPRMSP